jgi:hypothetical protein
MRDHINRRGSTQPGCTFSIRRSRLFDNPYIATAVIGGGIFFVSYMLGRGDRKRDMEAAIETTIHHLNDNGYLSSYIDANGELCLRKLREADK